MPGQDGAGQRGRPEEVQVHQVAQLAVAGFFRGADRAAPGVVHQHVDAPVRVDHFADGGMDSVGVGDVDSVR